MKRLEKKLLNLAIGEFAALCTFILVYRSLKLGMATLVAFSYLLFILLQGSLYWLYRYRLLINAKSVDLKVIKLFRSLKYLNMILSVILGMMIPVVKSGDMDFIVAAFVLLFGIIEYINYYWYRLSYGKSGFNIKILSDTKCKRSSISKMISKL